MRHVVIGFMVPLMIFVLFFLAPVMAIGALKVTTDFDMDRDGDVDGSDLSVLGRSAGWLHAGSVASQFGEMINGGPTILTPKVLVINFDPVLEDYGNVRLTTYLGWNAVGPLVEQYSLDIQSASGGQVNYVVVETHDVDAYPLKQDGYQYTDETYLACQASGGSECHDPDIADYGAILADLDVSEKLNNGDIDEVWLFGGPWFGYYESRLAGPGAFWYNSFPLEGTRCDRLLPIMGFNYERGPGEMLHSFGHRAESSMTHVFGGWDVSSVPRHDWDLFGHNLGQSSSITNVYQCGSVHYPPNGMADYDYSSGSTVESVCDDWFDYPDSPGNAVWINCEAWGCNEYDYLIWWLDHLPRQDGFHDGKLLNWWQYIVGNRYDEIYPRVIDFSSEYADGWADRVLDGNYGTCNSFEWATAGQPTGWVQILVNNDIDVISISDRACPEQVTAGHIEFDDGTTLSFNALDNAGTLPTTLVVNKTGVQWIKLHIDASTGGANPGIGEVVFEYMGD